MIFPEKFALTSLPWNLFYKVESVYNGFVCNVNSPITLHFVRSRWHLLHAFQFACNVISAIKFFMQSPRGALTGKFRQRLVYFCSGPALISCTSYLTISPIAAIKSFWITFEKPQNTVDVSKCLANLSQQKYVKVPHSCHDYRKSNSDRYYKLLIAVWLGNNLHWWGLTISLGFPLP